MARKLTDQERESIDRLTAALVRELPSDDRSYAGGIASALVRLPSTTVTEEDIDRILAKYEDDDVEAAKRGIIAAALVVQDGDEGTYELVVPEEGEDAEGAPADEAPEEVEAAPAEGEAPTADDAEAEEASAPKKKRVRKPSRRRTKKAAEPAKDDGDAKAGQAEDSDASGKQDDADAAASDSEPAEEQPEDVDADGATAEQGPDEADEPFEDVLAAKPKPRARAVRRHHHKSAVGRGQRAALAEKHEAEERERQAPKLDLSDDGGTGIYDDPELFAELFASLGGDGAEEASETQAGDGADEASAAAPADDAAEAEKKPARRRTRRRSSRGSKAATKADAAGSADAAAAGAASAADDAPAQGQDQAPAATGAGQDKADEPATADAADKEPKQQKQSGSGSKQEGGSGSGRGGRSRRRGGRGHGHGDSQAQGQSSSQDDLDQLAFHGRDPKRDLRKIPYVRRGNDEDAAARKAIVELNPRFWTNGWLLSHPDAYRLYEKELHAIDDALDGDQLPDDLTRRQLAYQMGGDEKFFEYGADGFKLLRAMGMEDIIRHRPMPKADLVYYAPRRRKHMNVLVTENLDPYLDIHDLMYETGRSTILGQRIHAVVLGGGMPVIEHNRLSLLLDTLGADSLQVFYWGDIDRAGVNIMSRLIDELDGRYKFSPFTPAYQLMLDKAMERYPDPADNEATGQVNLEMPDVSLITEGLSEEAAAYAAAVVESCELIPQEILTKRDL